MVELGIAPVLDALGLPDDPKPKLPVKPLLLAPDAVEPDPEAPNALLLVEPGTPRVVLPGVP